MNIKILTISVFETDCYLLPDGDGSTSNTFTSDTKFRETSNEFSDDSMDEDDPCSKAKIASYRATQNSKSDAYAGAKTSITSMNNGKENGVVLGIVSNTVRSTTVQTGNEYSIGNLSSSFTNPIGDIHNHPNNNPPSPGDIYSLINIRNQHSNYNTRYVVTQDGTTYALVVTDTHAMNLFLQNYPPSVTVDSNGKENINFPNELLQEWSDLRNTFSLSGALAYILNKYNSGISLTKMDGAGNFRAINITTTQSSDGTTNYDYSLCSN